MVFMAGKIKKTNYSGTLTLEVLEGAYNYNKWIVDELSLHINYPLLEIGSGIGNISALLINNKDITLSDNEEVFINVLNSKYKKKNVKVINFDITKSPNKNLKNFKSVIGINVLEHIEDDLKSLIHLKKTIGRDGNLVLLVPAKKMAYNKLDKSLGHHRRYEKKELVEKLEKAGYEVEKIKFFNTLGLVTWIIRDYFTGQQINLTPRQISTFDRIVPILRKIEGLVQTPIGISLIVVAKPKR